MKKYPSIFIALFLILGIILNYFINFPIYILIIISLTGTIFFINKNYRLNILGISLLLISISVLIFQNSIDKFDYSINNKFFNITGEIKNIKYGKDDNKILLTNIFFDNIEKNEDMIIYIKDKNIDYTIGDKIKFSNKIYIPRNNSNTGEFNYYNYMLSKNIYAYSYVDEMLIVGKSSNALLNLRGSFFKFVDSVTSNLEDNAKDFVFSVATGNNILSEEYDELFTNLGILHIISVSGFHIVLIEAFILFLLGFLSIGRNIKRIFALILIFIYCLIIDFPPSAIRAFIFILTSFLASLYNLPKLNIKTLSIACIIVLLINPTNILDIGFQFSFLATLGIVFIYPLLVKNNSGKFNILNTLILTIIINFLLFPLQIFYFNKIQLATLIGNLLAIPLLICIIYMSVFLMIFSKIYFLNISISKIISTVYTVETFLLQGINNIFKSIDFNLKFEDVLNIYILIFLLIFLYFIKDHIKNNLYIIKKITIILIPMFLLYSIFRISSNPVLKVTAINVGQGDSFLLESHNFNILFDTGGSFKENNSFKRLDNYLSYSKIHSLDAVFLSHFDEDHAGNIVELIKKYGEFPIYSRIGGREKFIEKYKINKDLYHNVGEDKDIFKFDSITMSFFNSNNNNTDENDNSIVILLNVLNNKILFTGDISTNIEGKIIDENINSNILKIPHHGSKTSSSREFIEKVNPSAAILSVGENNSYNLPNEEVVKRYVENGIKVFRTDYDGTIFVEFYDNDFNIFTKKDLFFKNLLSINVYNDFIFSILILAVLYYVSRYDYDKTK